MSTQIKKKIKKIREAEKLTQLAMAMMLDIPVQTLQRYELGMRKPDFDKLQRLAKKYPQYALWLLTDKIDLPNHTSPEIVMQEREVGHQSRPKTA